MPQAPYTLEQAEEDIADVRGQMAYLGEVGSALNLNLPGAAGASLPGITVTAASMTTIASAAYPAGHAAAGAVYELEVIGSGTWGGTAQTLTAQVSFGGNAMASFGLTANAFPASQGIRWTVRARIICQATGVSGAWSSELGGVFSCFGTNLNGSGNTTGASLAATSNDAGGTTTVDSTSSQVLALQMAWGATTGAPFVTSRVAMFRRTA